MQRLPSRNVLYRPRSHRVCVSFLLHKTTLFWEKKATDECGSNRDRTKLIVTSILLTGRKAKQIAVTSHNHPSVVEQFIEWGKYIANRSRICTALLINRSFERSGSPHFVMAAACKQPPGLMRQGEMRKSAMAVKRNWQVLSTALPLDRNTQFPSCFQKRQPFGPGSLNMNIAAPTTDNN